MNCILSHKLDARRASGVARPPVARQAVVHPPTARRADHSSAYDGRNSTTTEIGLDKRNETYGVGRATASISRATKNVKRRQETSFHLLSVLDRKRVLSATTVNAAVAWLLREITHSSRKNHRKVRDVCPRTLLSTSPPGDAVEFRNRIFFLLDRDGNDPSAGSPMGILLRIFTSSKRPSIEIRDEYNTYS